MEYRRGNTYIIDVQLQNEQKDIIQDIDVEKAQFIFDDLIKTFPTDVSFSKETQAFLVNLSQEETLKFDDMVNFQVRIKFKTGQVTSTDITYCKINPTLSEEIL